MVTEPRMLEALIESTGAMSLHRKLAEVMAEADRIPKNGTYTGQGSFKYVLVGDAADAIRKALGERNVSMLPSAVEVVSEAEHATRSGGTMTTLTIRTTWTLTDGETGETATIQSIGTGADAGDKASPKAQTNAMKYALLMGFLLSTGDDPEQSDTSDRRPRRGQAVGDDDDDNPNDGSLIGTVTRGKPPCDLELRNSAQGPTAGFKLAQGRSGLQVLAEGNLATALQPFLANLVDQRVSVWGQIEMVPWAKGGKDMPPYRRLMLNRIKTADWTLPGSVPAAQGSAGPDEEATDDEPPDDVALIGEREAASVPLFDE